MGRYHCLEYGVQYGVAHLTFYINKTSFSGQRDVYELQLPPYRVIIEKEYKTSTIDKEKSTTDTLKAQFDVYSPFNDDSRFLMLNKKKTIKIDFLFDMIKVSRAFLREIILSK